MTCSQTEQTGTHGVGVYIHSEGGDVVLRFGQLVKESHNIKSRVFQKTEAYR